MSIENLVGSTILSVEGAEVGSESIYFRTDKGVLRLHHWQNCCERVQVEDINGEAADLIGGTVSVAESRFNQEGDRGDYRTRWTFYTIRTSKGDMDIRWLGNDNGYYSVAVSEDWESEEGSEEY